MASGNLFGPGQSSWPLRERLALASAIMDVDNQQVAWASISRKMSAFSPAPNSSLRRPANWCSPRACARQYALLIDLGERIRHRQKATAAAAGPTATAGLSVGELIVNRLTADRVDDLRDRIRMQKKHYSFLKAIVSQLESGQLDDHLQQIKSICQVNQSANTCTSPAPTKRRFSPPPLPVGKQLIDQLTSATCPSVLDELASIWRESNSLYFLPDSTWALPPGTLSRCSPKSGDADATGSGTSSTETLQRTCKLRSALDRRHPHCQARATLRAAEATRLRYLASTKGRLGSKAQQQRLYSSNDGAYRVARQQQLQQPQQRRGPGRPRKHPIPSGPGPSSLDKRWSEKAIPDDIFFSPLQPGADGKGRCRSRDNDNREDSTQSSSSPSSTPSTLPMAEDRFVEELDDDDLETEEVRYEDRGGGGEEAELDCQLSPVGKTDVAVDESFQSVEQRLASFPPAASPPVSPNRHSDVTGFGVAPLVDNTESTVCRLVSEAVESRAAAEQTVAVADEVADQLQEETQALDRGQHANYLDSSSNGSTDSTARRSTRSTENARKSELYPVTPVASTPLDSREKAFEAEYASTHSMSPDFQDNQSIIGSESPARGQHRSLRLRFSRQGPDRMVVFSAADDATPEDEVKPSALTATGHHGVPFADWATGLLAEAEACLCEGVQGELVNLQKKPMDYRKRCNQLTDRLAACILEPVRSRLEAADYPSRLAFIHDLLASLACQVMLRPNHSVECKVAKRMYWRLAPQLQSVPLSGSEASACSADSV